MAEIVVVGAGPAGISAAERLCARGHRVLLIDEGRQAGGQGYRQPSSGLALDMAKLMGTEAGKYEALHARFARLLRSRSIIARRPWSGPSRIERFIWFKTGVSATLRFDALLLATGADGSDRAVARAGRCRASSRSAARRSRSRTRAA